MMHPRHRKPLIAALGLALLAAGCSVETSRAPAVPATVDEEGLLALARPSGGEKAVLLNFWTTW